MQGYLNAPQALREIDGQCWYVTGDKGVIEEDGFLTLIDRYARFAKIDGEMISLSAVETAVKAALEDTDTALMAVNIPDSRKGERVVLLSETALDAKTLKTTMLANGTPPMMIPNHWFTVESIPHIGSGKTDFAEAKRLAQAQLDDAN